MDLGISGRWAIVCAASQGLGKGCAEALAHEGVNLVINARTAETLEQTATELRARFPAIEVRTVVGDVAQTDIQETLLAAAPQVDILVNNAGGPPPGDFRDWDRTDWLKALDANMLTPIALMKAVVDGMAERGFGRVINITSGAVKAPIDILGLSNGARSGLTGFIAGVARQHRLAGKNVTLNNLLPGAFDTARLQKTLQVASQANGDLNAVTEARIKTIPAARFGTPEEFGAYCAFLCSNYGGYITGQNLLIDGGAYPGTF
ncbi:SDR family oxidoreductase [Paenalcaligenes suwonensis]|uniref:SDR family oxidoreductase n=1 Tax=Paenalcaligenes suwonensis TaxID=1202713 RepID=UPI00140A307C|nr:SDR family oxidoreductase [Paenalcaligenes suwonensis]NHC61354.1 SDR family oxidoreductase [Paenalcaligenes suwonensis]